MQILKQQGKHVGSILDCERAAYFTEISHADEHETGIREALVENRYARRFGKRKILSGEDIPCILPVKKATYVVLPLILPAGGKHGALDHRRATG